MPNVRKEELVEWAAIMMAWFMVADFPTQHNRTRLQRALLHIMSYFDNDGGAIELITQQVVSRYSGQHQDNLRVKVAQFLRDIQDGKDAWAELQENSAAYGAAALFEKKLEEEDDAAPST